MCNPSRVEANNITRGKKNSTTFVPNSPTSTSIGRKTQTDRLENIKSRYLKSTGQKMQSKATPIREAVVVIKSETTMEDLKSCPMHTASGSG